MQQSEELTYILLISETSIGRQTHSCVDSHRLTQAQMKCELSLTELHLGEPEPQWVHFTKFLWVWVGLVRQSLTLESLSESTRENFGTSEWVRLMKHFVSLSPS